MADEFGFITEESDNATWTALYNSWIHERKPGYVMKGHVHYLVFIENDKPKFKAQNNENLYNDVSMGN